MKTGKLIAAQMWVVRNVIDQARLQALVQERKPGKRSEGGPIMEYNGVPTPVRAADEYIIRQMQGAILKDAWHKDSLGENPQTWYLDLIDASRHGKNSSAKSARKYLRKLEKPPAFADYSELGEVVTLSDGRRVIAGLKGTGKIKEVLDSMAFDSMAAGKYWMHCDDFDLTESGLMLFTGNRGPNRAQALLTQAFGSEPGNTTEATEVGPLQFLGNYRGSVSTKDQVALKELAPILKAKGFKGMWLACDKDPSIGVAYAFDFEGEEGVFRWIRPYSGHLAFMMQPRALVLQIRESAPLASWGGFEESCRTCCRWPSSPK